MSNLRKYFKGKTGAAFWTNAALALAVVLGVPFVTFSALNLYTRHGQKIEVPAVTGKSIGQATEMLEQAGLMAEVTDSDYNASLPAGTVLAQIPDGGAEVKGGRPILLTVNRSAMAPCTLPDLVRNATLRVAEQRLHQLGFTLLPTQYVYGEPEDLVIKIMQGTRRLYGGESVPRGIPLTLYVGAEQPDTLGTDTLDAADTFIDDSELDDGFDEDF